VVPQEIILRADCQSDCQSAAGYQPVTNLPYMLAVGI